MDPKEAVNVIPSPSTSENIFTRHLDISTSNKKENLPNITEIPDIREKEILYNTLEDVAFSFDKTFVEEKDTLDLKYLKKDEYGIYFDIDEETKQEIKDSQKFFEPLFLTILEKYKDSPELSDIDPKNPFCFSPRTLDIVSKDIIIPVAKELEKILGNVHAEEGKQLSWEEAHISGILGKLLALESFRLSRIMATRAREYVEKQYQDENTIRVKEYCTGAGINTGLLYLSLARTGKNIQIHTVDNALQSVACSAGFLTSIGVPTRIILDSNVNETNFNGVSIYFDTALHFSNKQTSQKYQIIVSDSGLNYLPENSEILKQTPNLLDSKGMVQICTLDPSTEINLSKFKMLSTIAFGNHVKIYQNHKDNIYEIKKKKRKGEDGMYKDINEIKQMFSSSTSLQYNILKELFKLDKDLFWEYLNGAKAAAAITKDLSPKIKIDLRESGDVLRKIYPDSDLEYIPSYEDQDVSLTRILELTTAPSNGKL